MHHGQPKNLAQACLWSVNRSMLLLQEFQLPPAIDHRAEQVRGPFGIIDSRVRLTAIERVACRQHGLAQYCLTKSEPTKTYGVKAAEGMKRVALITATTHCHIEKAKIESGVVADQDGALAIGIAHCQSHGLENMIQCQPLGQRTTQRVVRINTGDFKRTRVDVGAGKGLDMGRYGLVRMHEALGVHADADSSNFQQCIVLGIETTRFNIDDNGEKTTKAFRHACGRGERAI